MANIILLPDVVGSNDAWSLGAGSSKVVAADPGAPPNPDRTTYIESAAVNAQEFKPKKDFDARMTTVASVTIYIDARTVTGSSSIRFRIIDSLGTWTGTAFAPAADSTQYSATRTTLSDNSTAWSEAALRHADFAFGVDNLNTDWTRVNALWVESAYASSVTVATFPRMTISQMVHDYAMRHGFVSLDLPIWAMDMRYMDNLFLTHPEGPHPDGEGWKDLDWERRLLKLFGVQFDPDGDLESVHAAALDLRKYIAYLRDTAVCPYSLSSAEDEVDGQLRIDLGATRTITRASVATVEDVGGTVVQVASGAERIGPDGLLVEGYRKNFAKASSFKTWSGGAAAAPDGYTEVDGDASLTIARVTNTLFDTGLSTYGIRLTSTSSGDYGLNQATSFAWEQDVDGVLSIDHQDHSDDGLLVGLQKSSDSYWWNPASGPIGAWQAGAASFRFSSNNNVRSRDHMPFNMPAASTDTFLIYIRSDASNHDVTLYHNQLEGGTNSPGCKLWYPTARIITESTGSAIVREADEIYLTTNPTEGRRVVHSDHGTLYLRMKILYAHDDLDNVAGDPTMYFFYADFWTNTSMNLQYQTANDRFAFAFRASQPLYNYTLTAGEYVFACRWCSTRGELGLASRKQDIFVTVPGGSPTKGTDVAAPVTDATEDNTDGPFYYGRDVTAASVPPVNGFVSRYWSTPLVHTDEEVKANMARMAP